MHFDSFSESPIGGLKPATELKKGGVMDFLSKPSSGLSPAKDLVYGASVMDILGKKSTTGASASTQPPLSSLFQKPSSSWSCPTCMVQNKDSIDKCPCCETPKPSKKAAAPSAQSSSKTDSKTTSTAPPLSTLFKKTDSGWSCPMCMVQNKDSMDKCPCCETAKPGGAAKQAAPATKTQSSSLPSSSGPPLSSLFKNTSGWSCPTCMVQNKDEIEKCPCCETLKPGSKPSQTNSSKPISGLSKSDTLVSHDRI